MLWQVLVPNQYLPNPLHKFKPQQEPSDGIPHLGCIQEGTNTSSLVKKRQRLNPGVRSRKRHHSPARHPQSQPPSIVARMFKRQNGPVKPTAKQQKKGTRSPPPHLLTRLLLRFRPSDPLLNPAIEATAKPPSYHDPSTRSSHASQAINPTQAKKVAPHPAPAPQPANDHTEPRP